MLHDLRLVSVAEIGSKISSLITIPLLTRALIPTEYGVYRSVFLIFSLFLFFQTVVALDALVQKRVPEISEEEEAGFVVASLLVFAVIIAISAGLLTIATNLGMLSYISPQIQSFTEDNYHLLVLLLVLTPIYRFGLVLCKASDMFGWFSGVKLMHESLFLFLIISLFLIDHLTLQSALWVLIIVKVSAAVTLLKPLGNRLTTYPDFVQLIEQFRQVSLPLVPRAFFKKAKATGPDALVISIFGASVFGKWILIFVFVSAFQLISQPFSEMLLPKISRKLAQDEPLDRLVSRYYRFMIITVTPAIIGGWILGEELIVYIYGQQYLYNRAVILILITAFGVQTINALAGSVFVGTNQSIYATYTQILTSIALFSFVIPGSIVLESLVIVSLGFLAENLVALGFAVWYQSNVVSFSRPSLAEGIRLSIGLLIMSAVVLVAKKHIHDIPTVLAVVALGVISYFTTLYAVGFFTSEDISVVKRFFGI